LGLEDGDALAVEQDQGTHHTQAAQVDRVDYRRRPGRRCRRGSRWWGVGLTDSGEFADGVADVDLGVALQVSAPMTVTGVVAS